MKIIEKKVPLLADLFRPDGISLTDGLFFDIETTGLSRECHQVYCIGALHVQEDAMQFYQWFAESPAEEGNVIASFFACASAFRTLFSFNGERFDLPFLLSRMELLQLPCPYKQFRMIDLYQRIKGCKHLLGLENCKQKTLERFLGIFREDQYHGGELIGVYHDYCKDHDPKKERILLLHNEEDILGMPKLLPLLQYPQLLEAEFSDAICQEETYRELSGMEKQELMLKVRCSVSVAKGFFIKKEGWYLKWDGNCLTVRIPLLQGELKHFFADYQNYYYLPMEDCAIHKSVAAYVEKEFRKKATAKTCYTKTTGTFLPLPCAQLTQGPDFYETEKKSRCYCLYQKELLAEEGFWFMYVKKLLALLK